MLLLCPRFFLSMPDLLRLRSLLPRRLLLTVAILSVVLAASGCGSIPGFKASRKVTVPPLLTPLIEQADTRSLIAEVNRLAQVRSIRGKVDIQFLDTSFAECGVAEKYRTADGTVTMQRPGQVFLQIQVPFVSVDIAQMSSDGERFRVAILQGEERYKRFLKGTNAAAYPRLESNGGVPSGCGDSDKQKAMNMRRTVSSLSGLRPQHFTDALLIPPVDANNSNLLYARTEAFEEELDPRPNAKRGARVVRGYYVLDEIKPEANGEGRITRRFWFDRVSELRLARVQTYDARGQLTTDVLYKEPKAFGETGAIKLPSLIELTRPQDRYSIRISYQAPDAVKLDRPYDTEVFVLENRWQLPEEDLDARYPEATGKK